MENHGCTYDPRPTTAPHTIVVSDRRNMRFEFFTYNPAAPDTFAWHKSVDMSPSLGADTLPCNMRTPSESRTRNILLAHALPAERLTLRIPLQA